MAKPTAPAFNSPWAFWTWRLRSLFPSFHLTSFHFKSSWKCRYLLARNKSNTKELKTWKRVVQTVICLSTTHKEANKEREWSWLIYSYFEKGCRKKCKRQSREVYCGWFWVHSRSSPKKFERMAREAKEICWRLLKESKKNRFDSYSVRNSVLIISHITFWDCRVHIFSGNLLSRNSCILLSHPPQQWIKSLSLTETSGWWSNVRWWDCGINPNFGCFGVGRINPRIIGKREGIAYLSAQICACTAWPTLHRRYGLRQRFGRCVFKLGSPLFGIKKMPHCFFVNRSVFFIPREDKALPSVQILFTELQSHLPFCPARDDTPRFFVFIFVATVSAYYDQHIVIWKKKNRHGNVYTNSFQFFWYTVREARLLGG